jgi:hypothetical protein
VRLKDGNGNMCTSQADMEAAIADHLSSVFGQLGLGAYSLDHESLRVTQADLSALDLPFTEEEVRTAVNDMPADRAVGPDGFTGAFYESACPVIKDNVIAALNFLFFGDSRAFHRLNNAYVVLLPKKPDASTPVDYCPITMIHIFGKLASS